MRHRPDVHRFAALFLVAAAVTLALTACGDEATSPPETRTFAFDYSNSTAAGAWTADFVDVAGDQQESVGFVAGHRALPESVSEADSALYQEGANVSDDLFMFFRRRVEGLEPGAEYRASFRITFASDHGQGCDVGLGPNAWIKAGASAAEPTRRVTEDGYLRLTVDKGSQSQGGSAALVLGDVRNGLSGCGDEIPYAAETLESGEGAAATVGVEADEEGRAWLFFGSESAFEVTLDIYVLDFEAILEPI